MTCLVDRHFLLYIVQLVLVDDGDSNLSHFLFTLVTPGTKRTGSLGLRTLFGESHWRCTLFDGCLCLHGLDLCCDPDEYFASRLGGRFLRQSIIGSTT